MFEIIDKVELTRKTVIYGDNYTLNDGGDVTRKRRVFRCPNCKKYTVRTRNFEKTEPWPLLVKKAHRFTCKHCNSRFNEGDYIFRYICGEGGWVPHAVAIARTEKGIEIIYEESFWGNSPHSLYYSESWKYILLFKKDKTITGIKKRRYGKEPVTVFSNQTYDIFAPFSVRIQKIDSYIKDTFLEELSNYYDNKEILSLKKSDLWLDNLPTIIQFPKSYSRDRLFTIGLIIFEEKSLARGEVIATLKKMEKLEGVALMNALLYGTRSKVKANKTVKKVIAHYPFRSYLYRRLVESGMRNIDEISKIIKNWRGYYSKEFIEIVREIAERSQNVDARMSSLLSNYDDNDMRCSQDIERMWERISGEAKENIDLSGSLKAIHDRLVEAINREDARQRQIELQKKAEKNKNRYKKMMKEGKKLAFTDSLKTIHIVEDVTELYTLGQIFHNCVSGYDDSVLGGDTLIAYAKEGEDYTACIELSFFEDKFEVVQVRAKYNRRVLKETKSFIKKWAKEKNLRISTSL